MGPAWKHARIVRPIRAQGRRRDEGTYSMVGPVMTSLESSLQALKTRFKVGSFEETVTYYLSLGDGEGEKWTLTVTREACHLTPGKIEVADCVLKMSADLFIKLVDGKWKPDAKDFMLGRIKTSDVLLLRRLQEAFDL
jgi:putative sterol carrier protein